MNYLDALSNSGEEKARDMLSNTMPDSISGNLRDREKFKIFLVFCRRELKLCLTIIVESTHNVGSIVLVSVRKTIMDKGRQD